MKFYTPTLLAMFGLAHCYGQTQPTTVKKLQDYGNGNLGVGSGSQWDGTNNRWIGNDNAIVGQDNSLVGNTNQVSGQNNWVKGNLNQIQGKGNVVKGGSNQIQGKGNVVQGKGNVIAGKGNIVSSGVDDDFNLDLSSRFPSWMTNSGATTPTTPTTPTNNKKKKVATPIVPKKSNLDIQSRFPAWMRSSQPTTSSGRSVSQSQPFGWNYGEYRPCRSADNYRRQPQWNQYDEDQDTTPCSRGNRWSSNQGTSGRWNQRNSNQYSSRQWADNFRQSLRNRIIKQIDDEFSTNDD